ncbi:hypothetical protein Acy02nite_77000 [Actinoplanes cyaneus]|uniref:Uncharacterized protein n=1 Tax=Actinoplanes cyaneus TaxID=52696 RepID=A0A919IQC9_9ACTN|nr:hypothetical protein [Actinoplanes cyaneus]MCW2139665.1 hypothetical protein [Actinoplanes cyaneus]GID69819.1 hypothetical protein Acy02nite_77000 [Actinoplanes cyaneus]
MVIDSARSMLHRVVCLLRAVLLAVFGGARMSLDDSLVDAAVAAARPVIGRDRVLTEQIARSAGVSRAPPALFA